MLVGIDEEHERQYNPRVAVGDVEPYFARAAQTSACARDAFNGHFEIPYGPSPLMTCDVFPAAERGAPVHAFLHGGYWRGRDKSDYSYLARILVPAGITAVIVNYDLCPNVRLPQIVDQVAKFFHWLAANAEDYGADPDRITASGHSAGAHLIAMAHARTLKAPVPKGMIRHAVLISGIYELEPVLSVSINEMIGLDAMSAAAMSPMRHLAPGVLAADVVVGGAEPAAWIGQSRDFAAQLGYPFRAMPGHNHFSITEDLHDPGTPLARLVVERALAR